MSNPWQDFVDRKEDGLRVSHAAPRPFRHTYVIHATNRSLVYFRSMELCRHERRAYFDLLGYIEEMCVDCGDPTVYMVRHYVV